MIDFKDNLGRHIALSARHLARLVARRLEEFGIGAGQYPYIFSLYIKDGQSQQSLAKNLAVDKAAAARAIGKLVSSGHLKRVQDKNDTRCFRVHLTPKSIKIRGTLEKTVASILDEMQKGLTKEERETANNIMKKIMANLQEKEG
ncbi:MAG: MarR family transcriptional regulator [Nitrospinae bacterium]|nr:MarR family transcriptional regulator [Nitrospinota bacterium]